MRTCAAGPCSHHGAQDRDREAAKLPGRFSCRTALTAFHGPTSSMIDKVLLSGVPAADRGWQIPRSLWEYIYKKHKKQLGALWAAVRLFVPLFLCLFHFRKRLLLYDPIPGQFCFLEMALSYHGSRSFLRTTRGRLPPCHFPSALQMLRPQMLRPKYSFSLPYGAVPVNLRFPQGQGRQQGAGHCEDTMMANWVICSSVAVEGTMKLNYF